MTAFMSSCAILFAGYSQYLEAVAVNIRGHGKLIIKNYFTGRPGGAFEAAF